MYFIMLPLLFKEKIIMVKIPVLVATKETQGQRPNDFCLCEEGEIVTFSTTICDGEEIDGHCGCRRSMSGLVSKKATTTVKVVMLEGGLPALQEAIRTFFNEAGWASMIESAELRYLVRTDAEELTRLAAAFPLGSVVEIRGKEFITRKS
jgi:hypothetical protein